MFPLQVFEMRRLYFGDGERYAPVPARLHHGRDPGSCHAERAQQHQVTRLIFENSFPNIFIDFVMIWSFLCHCLSICVSGII